MKTLTGYLNMMKRVECIPITTLKGYKKLSKHEQLLLGTLSAGISNDLSELLDSFEGIKYN